MSLEEELAVLAGGFVLQGAWIRKRNVNPMELISHVRVYSGSWKWATRPQLCPQELHSRGGVQQEAGREQGPGFTEGPSGCHSQRAGRKESPTPAPAFQILQCLGGLLGFWVLTGKLTSFSTVSDIASKCLFDKSSCILYTTITD